MRLLLICGSVCSINVLCFPKYILWREASFLFLLDSAWFSDTCTSLCMWLQRPSSNDGVDTQHQSPGREDVLVLSLVSMEMSLSMSMSPFCFSMPSESWELEWVWFHESRWCGDQNITQWGVHFAISLWSSPGDNWSSPQENQISGSHLLLRFKFTSLSFLRFHLISDVIWPVPLFFLGGVKF